MHVHNNNNNSYNSYNNSNNNNISKQGLERSVREKIKSFLFTFWGFYFKLIFNPTGVS